MIKIIILFLIKIGSLGFYPVFVSATEVDFSAKLDRDKISLDEVISLEMIVRSHNSQLSNSPTFQAPDFSVIHESSSYSMSSQYSADKNQFFTINEKRINRVLKPLKEGMLKITQLSIQMNGKSFSVPDLNVTVLPSGSSSSSQKNIQRKSAINSSGDTQTGSPKESIFVNAEISKKNFYKNEQIIIGYYLYSKEKIFNIQVDKFPILKGFLREDLDIPVMRHVLESEPVEWQGQRYERSLLAKYAAYPLKEGILQIDTLSLKYQYSPSLDSIFNQDDIFFGGLFQHLTPRVGSAQSQPISFEVWPLPEQGRPQTFTGGIGDFQVNAAVNRYEVRVNEALMLTLQIEGQGNTSAIQLPEVAWPPSIELYESKGRHETRLTGSIKVFELLLIPRQAGKVVLPAIEIAFFNPTKNTYEKKITKPIELKVLDALIRIDQADDLEPLVKESPTISNNRSEVLVDLRYLKPPQKDFQSKFYYFLLEKSLFFGSFLLGILYLIIIFIIKFKNFFLKYFWVYLSKDNSRDQLKVLRKNFEKIQSQNVSFQFIQSEYEKISDYLFKKISKVFQIEASLMTKSQLRDLFLENPWFDESFWIKLNRLLEFIEWLKFSGQDKEVQSEIQKRAMLDFIEFNELNNLLDMKINNK